MHPSEKLKMPLKYDVALSDTHSISQHFISEPPSLWDKLLQRCIFIKKIQKYTSGQVLSDINETNLPFIISNWAYSKATKRCVGQTTFPPFLTFLNLSTAFPLIQKIYQPLLKFIQSKSSHFSNLVNFFISLIFWFMMRALLNMLFKVH